MRRNTAQSCGSWLASDSGLRADISFVDRVHNRFFGNGYLWFRAYSELLGKAPSNQALLPLSFGASPRLGMPSLRSCSVGPPRSAILGRARLTRHPCRVTHCAEPPLGLSRRRIPQQPKRGGLTADLNFVDVLPQVRVFLTTLCKRRLRSFDLVVALALALSEQHQVNSGQLSQYGRASPSW